MSWAEYAMDIARLAHEAGLKTVLVTNGFITTEAAAELYPLNFSLSAIYQAKSHIKSGDILPSAAILDELCLR